MDGKRNELEELLLKALLSAGETFSSFPSLLF